MKKWWSHMGRNEKAFYLVCFTPLALILIVSVILLIVADGEVALLTQMVLFFLWCVGAIIYISVTSYRRSRSITK